MPETGRQILIVEDEAELLDMVDVTLRDAGFSTLTAANGREGLELLSEHSPDLVICDIMMPEVNGYDFLWEVRYEHAKYNRVPVIFLTSLSADHDKIAALGIGVDAYIVKPVNLDLLVQQVRARLQQVDRIVGSDAS